MVNPKSNLTISKEEYRRMYCEISPADFNTFKPNPNRISRIAKEIDDYFEYKRNKKKYIKNKRGEIQLANTELK